MTLSRTPKERRCKAPGCCVIFTPARMGQKACGVPCAVLLARAKREQEEARAKREERAKDRQTREEMKTLPNLLADAQIEFNRYIRYRDTLAGLGCIDCGRPFEPEKPGGSMDAGHYMSRGHSSQLRFDERNVHAQRKNCNRPGGTSRAAFRAGMVERVGESVVEELERNSEVKKWTKSEARDIRTQYKMKANQLSKQMR